MKQKRFARLPVLTMACLLALLVLLAQGSGAAQAKSSNPAPLRSNGNRVVAYFTQWGIYSGFFEKNLVSSGTAAHLTTLDYAFGNISPDLKCFEANQAGQGDAWADYERPFAANESVNGQADMWGQTLGGNFNQLRELKQLYPNLKFLLAIGGWTWSSHFSDAALPQNRAAFVQSCINQYILGNLPQLSGDPSGGQAAAAGIFDGFDLDWEFPAAPGAPGNVIRPEDTTNFTGLLAEFRHQLDALGQQTGKHYLLSAALSAGQDKYSKLELNKIGHSLDWGSLMTYDMHGPWSATGPTDFNAPLFCDPRDPSPAPANTYCINHAVHDFLRAGFPASKLVLGIPIFGHGWTNVPNVNHGLFQSDPNMQPASLGGGTADYNVLKNLNFPRFSDKSAATSWVFDGTTFWSYDDPTSVTIKMGYVRELGLGGAMAWSLDGDDSSGTLMNAVYRGLQRP